MFRSLQNNQTIQTIFDNSIKLFKSCESKEQKIENSDDDSSSFKTDESMEDVDQVSFVEKADQMFVIMVFQNL